MGCTSEVNINDHIDSNSSLILKINKTNLGVGQTSFEKREIKSNSEKFKRFIEWGIENQDNWTSTPASYCSNVVILQNDFRLLYNNDFVVIEFTVKNGKVKQYSKSVKNGDLDFLTALNWKTFKDTVANEFTLMFKYSENRVVESIQNGKCIGNRIENPQNDITNTMEWCIWMQDTSTYSFEHFISVEKSNFNGNISEHRDTITIDNTKALMVTLKNSKSNAAYRRMIYLKKHSTLFEIIDNIGTNDEFERFYKSIEIRKIIKASS